MAVITSSDTSVTTNEKDFKWGVYNSSGEPFVDYDSIDGFMDSLEAIVPSEAQENGALFSYDKVRQPHTATVELLFSGMYSESKKAFSKQGASLSKLKTYLESTETFEIVSPDRAIENMAVVGYSVTRQATENAGILAVEVSFKEIMNYKNNVMSKSIPSPANATSVPIDSKGSVSTSALDDISKNATNKTEGIMGKIEGAVNTVQEKFQGVKESVSSAVATVRENIETVRSTVSSYVDKARAVQNWARSQMVSISGEISAVKSTFNVVKEVTSLNGVKKTFWSSVNNAKSTMNVAKSILKGFE